MELSQHIEAIRKQLESGVFTGRDEIIVSDNIVRRLIPALKWDVFDLQRVIPQYEVRKQKVDFALCDPTPARPIIFIEVKKLGNINESAEEQLFRYAFNKGVPIVLLTDGREWQFYYPRGEGDIADRLVYKIDLLENDNAACVTRLNRYLNYEEIQNGNAVSAIQEDYTHRHIQKAWETLLTEADTDWIDVIVNKTEHLCGHKPTEEQVKTFLKNMVPKGDPSIIIEEEKMEEPSERYFMVKFLDDNTTITDKTIVACYAKAIDKLVNECGLQQVIQADEDYIDQQPNRKLRHISINKEDVDHPPNFKARKSETGNYYISTYNYTNQKKKYLEEIANLLNVKLEVKYSDVVS
ncbi:hypothetical protein F4212_10880 [Candidatus Poribacteria bacterium]|nr:hypothetical protein [Candidatus Poribacteria bacterium]